jgi:sortase A
MGTRVQRLRLRTRRRARRRLGLCLILVGLALLGAVAYQLWGTGIVTSRAQAAFRKEIAAHGFPHRARLGRPIGVIRIDAIELDMAVVQGANWWTLMRGPGHYVSTPLPGQGGNVAIAGHRTTFLHPFGGLDRVRPGDLIAIQTANGEFVYRVVWQRIVPPGATWVTKPTAHPSLTLTTCWPRFSSAKRLVVRAVQVYGAVPGGFLDEVSLGSQSTPTARP